MSSLLLLFARGLAMGFAIAAPVGAIGVLCIRRTLAGGTALGLATGLGAATADGVYGAVAALGLTAISAALVGARAWLGLAGGVALIYLGTRTMLARPAEDRGDVRSVSGGLAAAWGSTFLLTLGNPSTILAFIAVFAALGVGAAGSGPAGALALVAGVFSGSALWWLVLSGSVGLVRHRVSVAATLWIDRASGALIAAFGVAAALGGLALLGVLGAHR